MRLDLPRFPVYDQKYYLYSHSKTNEGVPRLYIQTERVRSRDICCKAFIDAR